MKFILNDDKFEIENQEEKVSGSINYYEIEIEHNDTWNNLSIEMKMLKVCADLGSSRAIINNKVYIDNETFGNYMVGFIGYRIENNKKVYQISTDLQKVYFNQGAGEIETQEEELPTPTQWEIYINQIQELVQEIQDLPSYSITENDIENWNNKVTDDDYVHTDNNFSNEYKNKLEELENYDDTQVWNAINELDNNKQENLISGSNIKTIGNQSILGEGNIDLPSGGNVDSVNGKTGVVILNAEDVGALPDSTLIPEKTSDLENDSGFIDETYHDNTKQNITDNNLQTTSKQVVGAINELKSATDTNAENINNLDLNKQDKTDNSLTTINKQVAPAINEVNSIAKGANQAVSYGNYSTMITAINSLSSDVYKTGQNIMIVTVEVPDLWVSGIEETSSAYTYVDDATVISDLQENGYIKVGYYRLSQLETQKVDLTDYVKNTDYATESKGGVFKTFAGYNTQLSSSGQLRAQQLTYAQYLARDSYSFIGKGTLENVLNARIGSIDSLLDTLNGEVI